MRNCLPGLKNSELPISHCLQTPFDNKKLTKLKKERNVGNPGFSAVYTACVWSCRSWMVVLKQLLQDLNLITEDRFGGVTMYSC